MADRVLKVSTGLGIALGLVLFATACGGPPQLPLGTFANATAPHGSAKLTLMQGGRYTLSVFPYDTVIKGAYAITQDTVVFTEDGGDEARCIGIPGTYRWAFDGSAIKWTLVSDDCRQRAQDWPSGPWTKQS